MLSISQGYRTRGNMGEAHAPMIDLSRGVIVTMDYPDYKPEQLCQVVAQFMGEWVRDVWLEPCPNKYLPRGFSGWNNVQFTIKTEGL